MNSPADISGQGSQRRVARRWLNCISQLTYHSREAICNSIEELNPVNSPQSMFSFSTRNSPVIADHIGDGILAWLVSGFWNDQQTASIPHFGHPSIQCRSSVAGDFPSPDIAMSRRPPPVATPPDEYSKHNSAARWYSPAEGQTPDRPQGCQPFRVPVFRPAKSGSHGAQQISNLILQPHPRKSRQDQRSYGRFIPLKQRDQRPNDPSRMALRSQCREPVPDDQHNIKPIPIQFRNRFQIASRLVIKLASQIRPLQISKPVLHARRHPHDRQSKIPQLRLQSIQIQIRMHRIPRLGVIEGKLQQFLRRQRSPRAPSAIRAAV